LKDLFIKTGTLSLRKKPGLRLPTAVQDDILPHDLAMRTGKLVRQISNSGQTIANQAVW